jgi:prepilin-type N-terminal cleavage/methylation domain-containing protein
MKLEVRKGKEGFTLVEVLVVICCAGILVALLVPGMKSAREHGNVAKSISNLRQMAAAMHNFVNDNNNMLPRADGSDSDPGQDWAQALRPYGASHRLPEPRMDQNPLLINPSGVSDEYPAASVKSSYCMNGNLQQFVPPPDAQSAQKILPLSILAVQKPTQTVLFGDSKYAGRAMNYSHLAYRSLNNTKTTVVFVDGQAEAKSQDSLSYEANFANPPTK